MNSRKAVYEREKGGGYICKLVVIVGRRFSVVWLEYSALLHDDNCPSFVHRILTAWLTVMNKHPT